MSKAMELPGVVDGALLRQHLPEGVQPLSLPVPPGSDPYRADLQPACACASVGDRIAAVVATTEEIARKAVSLIEVEYEEYPFALALPDETLEGKIDNMDEAWLGIRPHRQ